MRIVFMGTPEFSVPSLNVLIEEGYNVVAVVTQPDRPKGRKRVLTPPPVKVAAEAHGIPVFQPERLRKPEAVEVMREFAPDLIVTAAYGQILPKSVLDLPAHGCINVHASLLPKYRGGAPIHHSIMNGDPTTGVTIMYMEEGLDTGDMISKVELPISDEDSTGTMFDKLSIAGSELLRTTLPDLIAGRITAEPQNNEEATYSPNINRENELIDWTKSARGVFNQVRGLNPFPGAFTYFNGEVFKVWASELPVQNKQAGNANPGTVLHTDEQGIHVQTGDGVIILKQVQPAGKKAMEAAGLARGNQALLNAVFGASRLAEDEDK
ncbi:methionyl-tRNA formyltransferase [Paenibacillus sp. N1-5-1-14]|uniref:methionyl-tRNA formyltransferase n=1 Tax=Paenibacillus radicibacter TaxID=2972488 RepID=UPI002159B3B7|nr:methionyl-tRNA formyltransferase [Paenibacillus radicibacter]MCR8641712.1 methionyl-tRNA formyltransferase [Paenibacillus radicibacter]